MMSQLIILIVICLSFIFLFFKKIKATKALLAFLFILVLLIGQGFISNILLEKLQEQEKLNLNWKESNAIVILGFGVSSLPSTGELRSSSFGISRIYEGMRLYYICKRVGPRKCKIFLTGGDPRRNGKSEAEVMKDELISVGIPEDDIRIEKKSRNTFQNAQFTARMLNDEKFNQIILVTSGTHLKRSLLYFSHFGIFAIGAPSDYTVARMSLLPHSFNFILLDMAIHEYLGIMRFHFYNYMGWNAKTSKPTVQ